MAAEGAADGNEISGSRSGDGSKGTVFGGVWLLCTRVWMAGRSLGRVNASLGFEVMRRLSQQQGHMAISQISSMDLLPMVRRAQRGSFEGKRQLFFILLTS